MHIHSFLLLAEYPPSMARLPGVPRVTELELKHPAQGSERQKRKSCKIAGSSSTREGWGHNNMGIFSDENGDFLFI